MPCQTVTNYTSYCFSRTEAFPPSVLRYLSSFQIHAASPSSTVRVIKCPVDFDRGKKKNEKEIPTDLTTAAEDFAGRLVCNNVRVTDGDGKEGSVIQVNKQHPPKISH